ncbi:MAG: hypothetical protein K0V04_02085 [Deltaproteobacteria bacterium]|nr:hypothetical protein [Deltaproteobacteria bacterium]
MKLTYPTNRIIVSLCLFALPGCDFDPANVGEDPATTTATSTSGMGPGSGSASGSASVGGGTYNATTGMDTDPGGGSTSSGSDLGGGSTTGMGTDLGGGSTGGAGIECDPLLQDCIDGEGCYPDGGGFACDGPADSAVVGDACLVDTDCTVGTFCDVDVCVAFCDSSQPGSCNDPDDACTPWFPAGMAPPGLEDVGSCQPGAPANACDPLLQDCPVAEACYPSGNDFGCFAGGGPAQNGDVCGGDSDCATGLFCSGNVCAEFCDLGVGCTDPQATCEPWFPMGAAPPGLEDVGACVVISGSACDPLLQDCPAAEGCYPGGGAFECDVAGPAQVGDACGQGCAPGTLCDAGVCVALCDTNDVVACADPALACTAFYPQGTAPPGLEDVGTCLP